MSPSIYVISCCCISLLVLIFFFSIKPIGRILGINDWWVHFSNNQLVIAFLKPLAGSILK